MSRLRREAGLTVVEMVIVVTILMLALIPIYQFYDSLTRRQAILTVTTQLQSDARVSLDRIVRELRQAYSGDSATPAIESMSASGIQFLSPDRSTPYRLRRISYRTTGAALERSVALSTNAGSPPWTFAPAGPYIEVLTDVASTTIFQYLDAAAAPTSVPAAVRTVKVSLSVDPNSAAEPPAALQFNATIELRSSG